MKKNFTLFLGLLMLFITSCKSDDTQQEPTALLTLSPTNAIVFTADATETFEVQVSTNQDNWNVTSTQSWCKVVRSGDKFTVNADPNVLNSAPTAAIVTVVAGKAKEASLTVTQAAGTKSYPTDINDWAKVMTKTWLFPSSSDYISLDLDNDGYYTLTAKVPVAKSEAAGSNRYINSARYSVSQDLRTVSLNTFGTMEVTSLGHAEASVNLTLNGGTPSTLVLKVQNTTPATPSTGKRIKSIKSDFFDYNMVYENSQLKQMICSGKEGGSATKLTFNLTYETGKVVVKSTIPKGAIDDEIVGDVRVEYLMNSNGLATTARFVIDNAQVRIFKYKYNPSRQLISTLRYNKYGMMMANAYAHWDSKGNISNMDLWYRHKCDDSKNPAGEYIHDHNYDGQLDNNDYITFEASNLRYTYESFPNKGGFIAPNLMPEIFMNDLFSYIGYCSGVFGAPMSNLATCFNDGPTQGEKFTYKLDSQGYPSQLTIFDGKDSFSMQFTFE